MTKHNFGLPKAVVSNPVSKLFRPLFEAKKAKAATGAFLSAASLVFSVGVYPLVSDSPVSALEPTSVQVEVETELSGPAKPLPEMKRISQGYWAAHPGIDITAPLGSEIYSIKDGVVKEISISRYNYGRSVIVDHGNGMTSLYAHMGKIFVEEGQRVSEKTVLGEVGLTGRTTGPHLHLEVRKNGVPQNPMRYLHATLASL